MINSRGLVFGGGVKNKIDHQLKSTIHVSDYSLRIFHANTIMRNLVATLLLSLLLVSCGVVEDLFDTLDNVDEADPATDAPVAVIDGPSEAGTRSHITLYGDASYDPLGANVSYTWDMPSAPTGSEVALSSTSGISTSFFADKSGYYVVSLFVGGSAGVESKTTRHTVDVLGTGDNHAPVAIITPSEASGMVVLDGLQSYDIDGGSIIYSWTLLNIPDGSDAKLTSASNSVAYLFGAGGKTHAVMLVVSDGLDIDTAHAEVTPLP